MKKMCSTPITDNEKINYNNVEMVIVPQPSLPTQNIAAYLSGYILRKIPVNIFADCSNQLLIPQLPSLY